ncbi:uncharacterized protein LOC18444477 isoform X3 [Amborella trichopoda]|uniref:uncharacterized protein LOC18444477 isoform X3 n=1 Tax=Amborella trichopoda TaxID=13333 RepID=UPI0009BF0719|nr:uncharacterized protein LOC18444477 isoform X3 [Amborella trichopoda]|eukprot:XP_011627154.2 uncharacterized protein LOC18444477 isoform X3 [Amborella trichopoda]
MPLLSAYPFRCYPTRCEMGRGFSRLQWKKQAQLRLCNVSGFITELIEVHCDRPLLHVLFIPGNPGVVSFYKEFVEAIYGQLDEKASITAIGHISHTEKNWEKGRLFSLQEQIDHKIEFVDRQLQNSETPIVLVGHSIGSHISLEIFRRFPDKVAYCIGLYPFLTLNKESYQQIFIGTIAMSPILSTIISSLAALFGLLPNLISASLVKRSVGCSWSSSAVTATCTHLLKYHTVRNALFMAMTEFGKISKQAPGVSQSLEEEGHTHAFSCTEAGSVWVACHVVNLIKNQIFGLTLPEHDYMSGENRESGWRIGESVAVVTTSENPYIDFSRSMVQMIVEKEIYDQDELRELLRCFLSLNSKEHHETIIRAFAGICKYNPGFVRNL